MTETLEQAMKRQFSVQHVQNIKAALRKHYDSDPDMIARRQKLASLINGGYTNKAAGEALGIGKSAVSGMISRMQRQGWVFTREPKPVKAQTFKELQARRPQAGRPKGSQPPQPRRHIEHPPMKPVRLLDRTGCAFPTNEGGPYLFCNNTVREQTPYCEFHGNLMVNHA